MTKHQPPAPVVRGLHSAQRLRDAVGVVHVVDPQSAASTLVFAGRRA